MAESTKSSSNSRKENEKPCLKHAVDNLAHKSSELSSTASLCKKCSKTMVSYIFLVQEVLDNLAKSLYCGEDSSCCVQCLRQEFSANDIHCDQSAGENGTQNMVSTSETHPKELYSEVPQKSAISELDVKSTSGNNTSKPNKKPSSRRNSRRLSKELRRIENEPMQITKSLNNVSQEAWKVDFLYNVSPSIVSSDFYQESNQSEELNSISEGDGNKRSIIILNQECSSSELLSDLIENNDYRNKQIEQSEHSENVSVHDYTSVSTETLPISFNDQETFFNRREPPTEMSNISFIEDYKPDTQTAFEQFIDKENFLESFVERGKEIVPVSNCHTNEAFSQPKTNNNSCADNAINAKKQNHELSMSVEETSFDAPKQTGSLGLKKIPNVDKQNVVTDVNEIPSSLQNGSSAEAFVTMCRNNSEAFGCLVVGNSLLLSRTSKTLCVLVFNGVHTKLIELLSSVFHVVQNVATFGSPKHVVTREFKGNLEELDTPNVWRLVQFNKCVFLNPDTLVLRNCDELFNNDELSAVPDNGWPDCFNSGVFVFVPSLSTFSQMEEMARRKEYSDDGDQIFLNSFFASWSSDLSRKLSFIYNLNLIGATTYTYNTAFHKFGQNAKIVQFSGFFKPWDVKFYNETNQIEDTSNFHSTSLRFFYEWISIFRVSVLRLFPQSVYSTIFAQKIISVDETVKLLCSPEIYNTKQRPLIPHNHEDLNINKVEQEKCLKGLSIFENSENYKGMKVWEEGKMDYEGSDNSEDIIKRLQLLMQ